MWGAGYAWLVAISWKRETVKVRSGQNMAMNVLFYALGLLLLITRE
jgi:hypothetical protein